MNWFRRLLWAAENQEQYWREYHIERREKRLLHYINERTKAQAAVDSADVCIQYYRDKLEVARQLPQPGPANK